MAKALTKFTAAEVACRHVAEAALAHDPVTLEAYEDEARAAYDEKVRKLKSCPGCNLLNARGVRDQTERHYDETNGELYCAGAVPFP
jgi:hypothetical protein